MSDADLLQIYQNAVAAAEPREAVLRLVSLDGDRLRAGEFSCDLANIDRVVVVGGGKAGAGMAAGFELALGGRIDSGLVIVPDAPRASCSRITLTVGRHPLPDERGERSTGRILEMARSADARTLLIGLFSGGASALLAAPADGLTLEEKAETTRLLLLSGADIAEVNTVRKHLSAIKGGLLAAAAHPAPVLSLLISDVVGDRLEVIASGPTFPDGSTFVDAREVLGRKRLLQRVPTAVREHLERGVLGMIPDTPKPGNTLFRNVRHCVAASNRMALEAAAAGARSLGYEVVLLGAEVEGDAREAARMLAGEARRVAQHLAPGSRSVCLLSGGETTVTVTGPGVGGRNQEFALAFALEIDGLEGVVLLSGGTDGVDGPTDAAGAIVDGDTAKLARSVGLDPVASLRENDSHRFFVELGRRAGSSPLLVTGPTGTNVMDIQAVVVRPGRDGARGRA